MNTLYLDLYSGGNLIKTLKVPAQSVIETSLTITPNYAILPVLVSVENIVSVVNDAKYELRNEDEILKISEFVKSKFLLTPISSWQDHHLDLRVQPLTLSSEQYNEIQTIRNSVFNATQNLENPQQKQNVTATVNRSMKKHPGWWDQNKGEIFKFVATTTLSIILDTVFGIPLRGIAEKLVKKILA